MKWLKLGTFAMTIALVAVMAISVTGAFAQGPTTTNPGIGRTLGLYGSGLGGPQESLVAIAAKVLGMDVNALIAELNTGKTIASVAQAKGVALDKITAEFIAVRTASLQAAVKANRITQTQADAALAQIKAQVLTDLNNPYTPQGNGTGYGYNRTQSTNPMNGQFGGGRGRWTR